MANKFNCTSCGECCRQLGKLLSLTTIEDKSLAKLVEEFPYQANEAGVCEKLVENKCAVYDNRPLLCNVDEMYRKQNEVETIEEWHKVREKACNVLIRHSKTIKEAEKHKFYIHEN